MVVRLCVSNCYSFEVNNVVTPGRDCFYGLSPWRERSADIPIVRNTQRTETEAGNVYIARSAAHEQNKQEDNDATKMCRHVATVVLHEVDSLCRCQSQALLPVSSSLVAPPHTGQKFRKRSIRHIGRWRIQPNESYQLSTSD